MRKSIYFVFAVALILTCSNASAQSTVVVMKAMDGTTQLNGGSFISGHGSEIDILSNSHGEALCATCNVPSVSDFNVMINLSAATVSLKKLLLSGTFLTRIDVYYIKQGPTPFTYYRIRMENVAVTSVQESASSEGPIFAISFAPSRIGWQQIAQKADGTMGTRTTFGWDIEKNTAWPVVF